MKTYLAILVVVFLSLATLPTNADPPAQYIDRILRPCPSGATPYASAIAAADGDLDLTACVGRSVTINGTTITPTSASRSILESASSATIDVVAAGGTSYTAPGWHVINNLSVTETQRQTLIPVAGTIRRLFVRTGSAQPASGALVGTLRVNGANTTLTVSIPGGSAAGTFSDVTHSATVAAGDLISVGYVNGAASNSAGVFQTAVVFDIP